MQRPHAFALAGALLVAGAGACAPAPGKATLAGKVDLPGVTDAAGIAVVVAGPTAATTATAADGTWRLDHLRPGAYVVTVAAPSTREVTEAAPVTVPATGTAAAPTLTFQAVGTVTGTVTDGAGQPAPLGTVVFAAGTGAEAAIAADGSFTLDAVPVGQVTVGASDPGTGRAQADGVTVTWRHPTAVPPLVLSPGLAGGGRLEGRATVDGATDLSQVTVNLKGPVADATGVDATGHYAFTGLTPGTYLVTAAAPATREGQVSVPVTVAAAGTTTAPPLTLTPVGEVKGRVDLDGATTGNAGIAVLVTGARGQALAFTDDRGAYDVPDAPVGQVAVQAARAEYQTTGTSAVTVPWQGHVAVPGFHLYPAAAGTGTTGTVEGVARPLGQPDASGIAVTLTRFGQTVGTAITDAGGHFSVPGLAPGVYRATFDRGPYHATIDQLLSMPGTDGFVVYDGIQPLAALTLPRASRLATVARVQDAVFSATGDVALLSVRPDFGAGGARLVAVDPSSGLVRTLVEGATVSGMRLTVTGDRAVYFARPAGSTHQTLYGVATHGGAPVVLVEAPVTDDDDITPGGTVIATEPDPAGHGYDEVQVPLTGGAPQVLVSGLDSEAHTALSPNGQYLVVEDASLEVVSPATGQVTELAQGTAGYGAPHFAFSNTRVVVLAVKPGVATGTLESFPVNGGAPTPLATGVERGTPIVTADGSSVVFLSGITGTYPNTTGDLVATSTAGGARTVLATGVSASGVAVSPDGQTVVYRTRDGATHRVGIDGGASKILSTGWASGLVFSADGSEIAWRGSCTGPCGCEVDAGSAVAADAVPVAHDACRFTPLVLAPDGSAVFYLHTDLNGSARLGTVRRAAPDGSGPVDVLLDAWGLWTGPGGVYASRVDAYAPYGFQEGFYALSHP